MKFLPEAIINTLIPFKPVFSNPTWMNAQVLIIGAILNQGRRTVASCLKAMGLKMTSNFTNYHRVLNRAQWSSLAASKILLGLLVALLPSWLPLKIDVDETIERRKGKKINAKGYYRDPVRSSKKKVVKCFGLNWLSFMLIIQFPWAKRPWALPFLTILMPSKKSNEKQNKRHKTSIQWTIQALKQLRRWYPTKPIILLADGGFSCLDLLTTCIEQKITFYCRLRIDAKLYNFPEPNPPGKRGPKPKKGKRLPSFKQMADSDQYKWQCAEVTWYQGDLRKIQWITGVALWHKTGLNPVPIRWVLVKVPGEENNLQAYFCSDTTVLGLEIICEYMNRWSIEVTFEESRRHLGIETQRQWSDKAIARSTPILFGLFSIVCLMFEKLYNTKCILPAQSAWYKKSEITFSDVISAVRRHIWTEKYLNSNNLDKQLIFKQDEIQSLIDQLLEAA